MSDSPGATDLSELDARLSGNALSPGDDGWDAARQAWNLAADQHPVAVVLPQAPTTCARPWTSPASAACGWPPSPRATRPSGIASLDDTILLRTLRMDGVEVDAGARRARVEAGALWGDVGARAAEHGLVGVHGSAAEVGVVGYTLGGGLGWTSRLYGLAANSVLAIEVVTGDGELVRADHETEPDLFWALRGGGGSFGVVTAMEFSLYPLTEVYAGMIAWPADRGAEVIRGAISSGRATCPTR